MRFHGPTLGESKVPCERRRRGVLGAWRVPEGVDRRCGSPTRVSRRCTSSPTTTRKMSRSCQNIISLFASSQQLRNASPGSSATRRRPTCPMNWTHRRSFRFAAPSRRAAGTWRLSPVRHASTHCWRLAPPVHAPSRVLCSTACVARSASRAELDDGQSSAVVDRAVEPLRNVEVRRPHPSAITVVQKGQPIAPSALRLEKAEPLVHGSLPCSFSFHI